MDKLLSLLENFELTGSSLLLEDLEEAPQEEKTETGIILTGKASEGIRLKKGRVLKAGKGYIENGNFVKNPIEQGAIIYYKVAGDYELEGIKFKGTEGGQVVAYKNKTNEIGIKHEPRLTD